MQSLEPNQPQLSYYASRYKPAHSLLNNTNKRFAQCTT